MCLSVGNGPKGPRYTRSSRPALSNARSMSFGVTPSSWLMIVTTAPGFATRNERMSASAESSDTAPSSQKPWHR